MKGKVTFRTGAKVLLSLALLLGATRSYGQFSLHVGPTFGAQLTSLNSNVGKYNSGIGVNGGLLVEGRFGKFFSVEINSVSSIRTANRKYEDSLLTPLYKYKYSYNTTETFDYLENDLLLKFNLPLSRKRIIPYDPVRSNIAFLTFYAGPYYSVLLSYGSDMKGKTAFTDYDFDTTIVTDAILPYPKSGFQNDIWPVDIGAVAGLGIHIPIGKRFQANFDARYSMGFNNIDNGAYGRWKVAAPDKVGDAPTKLEYMYANVTQSAIQLQLGLRYRVLGGS